MPTINLEVPSAGQDITAGLHATNYADLQTLLNGNLDGSNINASAAISLTSLTIGGDTNLYRSAADSLKTDDTFVAAGNIRVLGATSDTAAQISLARNHAGAGFPGIVFGPGGSTTGDCAIYRSGADTLRSDDSFIAANLLFTTGEKAVRSAGTENWKLISGSTVVGTDSGGIATISYGITFLATPIVMFCNGDSGVVWTGNAIVAGSTSTTVFSIQTNVNSSTIRVNWLAYGWI